MISRFKAPFIVLIFSIVIAFFALLCIKISGVAFNKLGFPSEYSVYYLFLSILGSYVNIPLTSIKSKVHQFDLQLSGHSDSSHDIERSTFISVNLGGAIIPVIMSLFLYTLVNSVIAFLCILVMTAIVHKISKPVKGSGMAIHVVLPPLLAAAVALMMSPQDAPLIAYISGTIGCLIGIDILNLKKLPDLGVPAVSIGGSGTFDAIFLTGIISVLLA